MKLIKYYSIFSFLICKKFNSLFYNLDFFFSFKKFFIEKENKNYIE